jgi:4-amino-4-deoxy-L-arabinose transferase-like glycosyltransferase
MSSPITSAADDRFPSREVLLIAGIFVIALILRVLNILSLKAADPTFASTLPGTDMHTFEHWARSILQFGWLNPEHTPPLQAPLYAYFLASLMNLFGTSMLWIKLAQAFIGSISCVLAYLIGKMLFDKRVGAVASAMAAFYSISFFYEAQLLATTLITFLCLLSILLLLIAKERPAIRFHMIAGICIGLTVLAAPNIVLFLPFGLLWLWFAQAGRRRAMKLKLLAVLLTGAIAAIAPVTAKNYFIGHEKVLISKNGGICFYIGNCRDSTGTLSTPASMLEIASDYYQMTPRERAGINWTGHVVKQIKADPFGYMGLLFRKIVMFWVGYEIPNNVNFYLTRQFSPILRLPLLPFWFIAPLSLVGIGISLKQWRQLAPLLLFVIFYMSSIILFFVLSRFRLPLVPFLLIFAGYFIIWFFEKLRARDVKKISLSLIPLLLVASFTFISQSGYVRENDYANLAFAYKEQGQCGLAVPEFEHALAVDNQYYPARKGLIDCYLALGETRAALEAGREAVRLDPDNPQAYLDLARVLQKLGENEAASKSLQTAAALKGDPQF